MPVIAISTEENRENLPLSLHKINKKFAERCLRSCRGEVMSEHSLLRMVWPSSGLLLTSLRGGRMRSRMNLRMVRLACVISTIRVRMGIRLLLDDWPGCRRLIILLSLYFVFVLGDNGKGFEQMTHGQDELKAKRDNGTISVNQSTFFL